MKTRRFPKFLTANILISGGPGDSGYELSPGVTQVVYNETAYNSFVRFWEAKNYLIDERKPELNELSGKCKVR